jgi:hypothetical protein
VDLPLLQVSAGNAHLAVQQMHVKQQRVATLCVLFFGCYDATWLRLGVVSRVASKSFDKVTGYLSLRAGRKAVDSDKSLLVVKENGKVVMRPKLPIKVQVQVQVQEQVQIVPVARL